MTIFHCPLCDEDIAPDAEFTVVPPFRMHSTCYDQEIEELEASEAERRGRTGLPRDPNDLFDLAEQRKMHEDLREMQRRRWRAEAASADIPMF